VEPFTILRIVLRQFGCPELTVSCDPTKDAKPGASHLSTTSMSVTRVSSGHSTGIVDRQEFCAIRSHSMICSFSREVLPSESALVSIFSR
jgi:hypothetical protein